MFHVLDFYHVILNDTENETFSCPWLEWIEFVTDKHAVGNKTMLFG
jgi:hypothetical protein